MSVVRKTNDGVRLELSKFEAQRFLSCEFIRQMQNIQDTAKSGARYATDLIMQMPNLQSSVKEIGNCLDRCMEILEQAMYLEKTIRR